MSSKSSSRCLLFITASFIQGSVSSNDVEQPMVKTTTATFLGKRVDIRPHQLSNEYHRSVSSFTRIPYAEPPVGHLRFARPVAKVVEGEFDATQSSVACPQPKNELWLVKEEQSEDCLTLDVFVPDPKWISTTRAWISRLSLPLKMTCDPPNVRLTIVFLESGYIWRLLCLSEEICFPTSHPRTPHNAAVMMWIHGGGYQIGAGSVQLPIPLAAFNDVIIVTINYRLGPLGFLATGDGSIPANIGLLDQRQALIWIQDNIEAFGGDPGRVTLFGGSAGSASVNFHLLSNMSAGLFSRAIMQSGAVAPTWTHFAEMAEAVQMTRDVAKAVGCDMKTLSELVHCLRNKPVEDFIRIYGDIFTTSSAFFLRPVADGQFLPDDPVKLVSEGSFNQADVIIGCLQNEGSVFTVPAMTGEGKGTKPSHMSHSTFRHVIAMNLKTNDPITLDLAQLLLASEDELSNPDMDFISPATKLTGQAMFLCPTFDLSADLSRAGGTVYTYFMTHVPSSSISGSAYDWLGATHAEDIPYVFGLPFMSQPDDDAWMVGRFGNEQEVEMSLQIMRYWSNFAKTGNPNLSTKGEKAFDSKYPAWPKSTSSEPTYKEFNPLFENHPGRVDAKECYFMKNLVPKLTARAEEMARMKSLLEEKVAEDSGGSCNSPESCP